MVIMKLLREQPIVNPGSWNPTAEHADSRDGKLVQRTKVF